jgi:hypothetical protein
MRDPFEAVWDSYGLAARLTMVMEMGALCDRRAGEVQTALRPCVRCDGDAFSPVPSRRTRVRRRQRTTSQRPRSNSRLPLPPPAP